MEGSPGRTIASTERTRVKRLPERASYDRDLIHGILDEALICHVGFAAPTGPVVIPTIHARIDDRLYLHGSPASRMLRSLKGGVEICVTATVVDGLVLARSALHHSMNYRSAVVMGTAHEVTDAAEKLDALRAVVEHVSPGRWDHVRRPSTKEFRQTEVLVLPIAEASAKVRSGGVADEPEDLELSIWAGVVPLEITAAAARSASDLPGGLEVPEHVVGWRSAAARLKLRT